MQHQLYHEICRREPQPQSIQRYTKTASLLLTAPNNIIFEVFGTILTEPPDLDSLLNYLSNDGIINFMNAHWSNTFTRETLKRLRREYRLDYRADSSGLFHNMPRIGPFPVFAPAMDSKSRMLADQKRILCLRQAQEHLMWRYRHKNMSQIGSLIFKLAIDHAFQTGKLKIPAFEEVEASFREWRSQLLIKLYAYGSARAQDQLIALKSSCLGDLSVWVANFIDGSFKKEQPDLVSKLAISLRDETKNCILITHIPEDALNSVATGSFRCVFLMDRSNQLAGTELISKKLAPLISSGQIYLLASLNCVKFVSDPNKLDSCC